MQILYLTVRCYSTLSSTYLCGSDAAGGVESEHGAQQVQLSTSTAAEQLSQVHGRPRLKRDIVGQQLCGRPVLLVGRAQDVEDLAQLLEVTVT